MSSLSLSLLSSSSLDVVVKRSFLLFDSVANVNDGDDDDSLFKFNGNCLLVATAITGAAASDNDLRRIRAKSSLLNFLLPELTNLYKAFKFKFECAREFF